LASTPAAPSFAYHLARKKKGAEALGSIGALMKADDLIVATWGKGNQGLYPSLIAAGKKKKRGKKLDASSRK